MLIETGGGTKATALAEKQSSSRSEILPSSWDACCVSTPFLCTIPYVGKWAGGKAQQVPAHLWRRLPALVWSSEAALAASQAQKIPVVHWKETPPIAVLGLGQGSSISHWEQKTVRRYLTLFVLSNTFCFLSELAWKLNQHSFLEEYSIQKEVSHQWAYQRLRLQLPALKPCSWVDRILKMVTIILSQPFLGK